MSNKLTKEEQLAAIDAKLDAFVAKSKELEATGKYCRNGLLRRATQHAFVPADFTTDDKGVKTLVMKGSKKAVEMQLTPGVGEDKKTYAGTVKFGEKSFPINHVGSFKLYKWAEGKAGRSSTSDKEAFIAALFA